MYGITGRRRITVVAIASACLLAASTPAAVAAEPTPGATQGGVSDLNTPVIPALGQYRVGFFIMQDHYDLGALGVDIADHAGPFSDDLSGAGDGRTFDPAMQPADNRVYLSIDYRIGAADIVVQPSCNDDRTSCKDPLALTPDKASITSDNSFLFPSSDTRFHVHVANSRNEVDGLPAVVSDLTFDPTPQGTLCIYGTVPAFPSVEIYRDNPDGSVTTIYQHAQARYAGIADLLDRGSDQQLAFCVDQNGVQDQ